MSRAVGSEKLAVDGDLPAGHPVGFRRTNLTPWRATYDNNKNPRSALDWQQARSLHKIAIMGTILCLGLPQFPFELRGGSHA